MNASRTRPRRALAGWAATLGLGLAAAAPAEARGVVLKLGTVAPKGTVWAKSMEEIAEAIARRSAGRARAQIYAGVVGDEPTIVRKMRIGQLQGAVLTSTGLALISREPMALQQPMVFDSYAELDAVRDQLEPELNRALEAEGFKVLAWGDAGWLHFFSKRPVVSPDDIRGLKTWMWAHDPTGLEVFKLMGFSPVVLSSIDLLPSLQTNMIEAFPSTAMAALALQAHAQAPHMLAVRWAPVIGATVLTTAAWQNLPVAERDALAADCRAIGARLRAEVRRQTEQAIAAMRAQGLQVHHPNAAQMQAWHELATRSRALVRGRAVSARLFDKVVALLRARRSTAVEDAGAAPEKP